MAAEAADVAARAARRTRSSFAEAGRLAAAASDPIEDQRGPVDYKRHLADELTRRVLRARLRAATGAPQDRRLNRCRSP